MPDPNWPERLLSLFTTPDRASAIAGDLVEVNGEGSPFFVWLDVLRTALGLWRGTVADAPWRVLMVAMMGCVLVAGPAIAGIAVVALFPASIGSPVSWIALTCFWWIAALSAGAVLGSMAPRRGMAACVVLAGAGGMLLVTLLMATIWQDEPNIHLVLFYGAGAVAALPLLIGGTIARGRATGAGLGLPELPR